MEGKSERSFAVYFLLIIKWNELLPLLLFVRIKTSRSAAYSEIHKFYLPQKFPHIWLPYFLNNGKQWDPKVLLFLLLQRVCSKVQ